MVQNIVWVDPTDETGWSFTYVVIPVPARRVNLLARIISRYDYPYASRLAKFCCAMQPVVLLFV